MTFKRMLKFAFTFAVLGAGFSASAQNDNVVTLANGTTLTWPAFVNAVNNPSLIKGEVDYNSEVAKAYSAAQAETKRLQGLANTATQDLTTAKTAYNDAVALVEDLTNQFNNKQADLTSKTAALSSLQGELARKQREEQVYKDQIAALPTKPNVVVATWLENIRTKATAFSDAFDNFVYKDETDPNTGTSQTIYYKVTGSVAKKLELAFDQNPGGFTEATEAGFATLIDGSKFGTLYVYMGANYTTPSMKITAFKSSSENADIIGDALDAIQAVVNSGAYSTTTMVCADLGKKAEIEGQMKPVTERINKIIEEQGTLDGEIRDLQNEIETLKGQINYYKEIPKGKDKSRLTELKDAYEAAQEAKQTADNNVVTATAAEATAKAAYDKAVEAAAATAFEVYKNVKLTGDVTVTDAISQYDGTINGQGHIINATTVAFDRFSGILFDAAVNGKFASTQVGAGFGNVASWANGKGAFYDADGVKTDNIATLAELGYTAREFYGVDFVAGKIVALTDDSKVYSITLYEVNNTVKQYVQKKNNSLYGTNGQALTIPVNRFMKSETRDLTGIANVFYSDLTCENVVITDDRKSFYCPVDLQAANVSYNRAFNAGKNAVCLPFDLTTDFSDKVTSRCVYSSEDAKTFYFNKVAMTINAYTPALIQASEAFTGINLSNVAIKQTPASQIVMAAGDASDGSASYGLLKEATRDEIGGEAQNSKVYGLSKDGKTFITAKEGAHFPAMRMVIFSALTTATPAAAKSRAAEEGLEERQIVILNEDGTSGVDNVATPELKVLGGNGAIEIIADADYSNVAVYTIDGRLAAKTDIVAGNNTVEVAAGIYIVMGKKVMVK